MGDAVSLMIGEAEIDSAIAETLVRACDDYVGLWSIAWGFEQSTEPTLLP